jgi:Leucine-rich repeat (LRR) protein
VLNNSNLETIDLSTAPQLETASLGGNNLSSITFNNPKLWGLDLTNNNFSTIDLHNLPVLRQLLMSNNKLSSIDLSPVASTLVALVLVSNQFTFATLPSKADFPNMVDAYYYGNQASVEVPVVDHKVDLSSQAHIGDYDTVYTWYYGEITVDTDTGEIDGELMSDGTDGNTQEYSIENGVTTFLVEYDEPVICVMTNETYPNLALYTTYLDISKSSSGIDSISAGINGGSDIVNVYNLQGSVVRKGVKAATATNGLAPGIYVVGNRKVLVR